MDRKLEMLADSRMWDKRFPEFVEKGISADVIVSLADPGFRLKLLRMIESGCYSFDPPRIQRIPKKNGKMREIYILSDLDRCVMALIADVYTQLYGDRIHPNCVSYQTGIGVPEILHSVSKKLGQGGYKADISKYFDSVSKERVNELLHGMDSGSPVDRLLFEFYNTDLVEIDGVPVKRYKSLGQGIALSTLLANLCLSEADKKLTDVCDIYLRYSDDILMLGDRADEAVGILEEELSKCGLSLNPKKIERINVNSEFVFLGGRVHASFVGMSSDNMRKNKSALRRLIEKTGRQGDRKAQRRAVRKVQRFLLEKVDGYGRVEYLFRLCTTDEDIMVLENYVKDQLKAVYAGRQNHTVYSRLTSNEVLKGLGWCSLVFLRHLYYWDRDAYNAKVRSILSCSVIQDIEKFGEPVPASEIALDGITSADFHAGAVKVYGVWHTVKKEPREDLMERVEEIWQLARLWDGPSPFATVPDEKSVISLAQLTGMEMATKRLILLLASSTCGMDGVWQKSDKFPEMVIFRDWVTRSAF